VVILSLAKNMAIFTVTNLNDSDVGSLRQAIIDANNTEEADEIVFSVLSGTLTLTTGELLITDSLTIQGTGITVSGNNSTRVFNIDDETDEMQQVTIAGLTITQGSADYGGGIHNQEQTTITNSIITQNVSGPDEIILGTGGGINNRGILNLVNSTVSGNSSFTGGGINNYSGQISIINSTISGNSAFSGGGIDNYSGQISIINSTISGNSATDIGGGIYNGGYSTAEILNVTISNNSAASGGGVYNNYKEPSSLIITNTIIANSSGGDFVNNGNFTSKNNLIEDGSDPNAISGDPNLSPLQNNGGSTLTHALLEGSIAINKGSNASISSGITTDQRGQERIIDGIVDIGAYESSSVTPPPPPPSFDAAQYGASYKDLILAFGYDLPALTNHYLTYGMAEGRSLDNFDEFRYIASSYVGNGDLINAFGLNEAAATEHYIRYGSAELRSLTAFSPSRYILSYPYPDDLLGAFGTNTLAATQHFITTGFSPPESRNPSLFPSDRYIASYGDLINAYQYNLEAGSNHYLVYVYGQGENRPITFDPAVYLMKNLDVAADLYYGASLERATEHYIVHGFADGHPAM
jgi:hypothetical protein